MPAHLQREMDNLKKRLISLCALVEDQVQLAVRALLQRDLRMAESVAGRDAEIDQAEVEIEEECLKTLALYQPVAIDLRLVVSALKINNDLERIGDLAVNIAHKALAFAHEPPAEIPFDIAGMWEKTQAMLRDSIDALVKLDSTLAHQVCARDDEIDQLKHEFRVRAEQLIRKDPERVAGLLRLLAVTRNLERIADCATNIAEDVIYMCDGRIVRHVGGAG
jgi:phosphate transport system protein